MNAALTGRGGGRSGFAQGSVQTDADTIHAFFQQFCRKGGIIPHALCFAEYDHPQEDEARQVYSELDREGLETRRVELYPNGLWFAYGDEHGREEALSSTPSPPMCGS